MKRILCTSIVLIMLLTACFTPAQQVPPTTELSGDYTYGVYELDFNVERLSGWLFEGWDVVYTYNNEVIESGYQVLLSVEVFTFYSVQVELIERDNPKNTFTATFPVAICDGGSGKTEITVTGSNGKTATFKVTCDVTQVGKQQFMHKQKITQAVGAARAFCYFGGGSRRLTEKAGYFDLFCGMG